MSVRLRMRRISTEDRDKGLRHIDAAFEATLDNAVYDTETASGVLCSLASDWDFVHIALTGDLHQTAGPSGLPVLGGVPLWHSTTAPEAIIMLSPGEVEVAADFLRSADLAALIEAHHEMLAERTGGILPEPFLADIMEYMESLRRFYGLAADAGQSVVKRSYA